jgi:DNA polymerase IV
VLRLRFGDFSRATRSRTLLEATASTRAILMIARGLLAASRPMIERRGLTLLGITITGLEHAGAGVQLALPVDGPDQAALEAVLDDVRNRFGPSAVTRAALLGRRVRPSPSLLPAEQPARSER